MRNTFYIPNVKSYVTILDNLQRTISKLDEEQLQKSIIDFPNSDKHTVKNWYRTPNIKNMFGTEFTRYICGTDEVLYSFSYVEYGQQFTLALNCDEVDDDWQFNAKLITALENSKNEQDKPQELELPVSADSDAKKFITVDNRELSIGLDNCDCLYPSYYTITYKNRTPIGLNWQLPPYLKWVNLCINKKHYVRVSNPDFIAVISAGRPYQIPVSVMVKPEKKQPEIKRDFTEHECNDMTIDEFSERYWFLSLYSDKGDNALKRILDIAKHTKKYTIGIVADNDEKITVSLGTTNVTIKKNADSWGRETATQLYKRELRLNEIFSMLSVNTRDQLPDSCEYHQIESVETYFYHSPSGLTFMFETEGFYSRFVTLVKYYESEE